MMVETMLSLEPLQSGKTEHAKQRREVDNDMFEDDPCLLAHEQYPFGEYVWSFTSGKVVRFHQNFTN